MTNSVASAVVSKVSDFFNFSVEKFPLSGPDNMRTEWFGLFRSDTSKPVGTGSVTSRYVPHQTDDVLALVESAAEAFDGEMTAECHFRDGHYVNLSPSKEYRRTVFGTVDNIYPRVQIHAGYDGKAFRATVGFYRDTCRNLAFMRQVSGTSVSIRHTSGLRSQMDELIRTFSVLKTGWGRLTDVVAQLSTAQVDIVQFLNAIYDVPAADAPQRAVTIHANRTTAIVRRLRSEMFSLGLGQIPTDFKVPAWLAFNAIQGYVQHDAIRKGDKSDFERALLASSDTAVAKAETLVMALAS
jgi:ketosteroid isomerase-like protein